MRTHSNRIAEELRHTITSDLFTKRLTVTVSLGLATLQNKEVMMDWLKRSDANLYQAKLKGRNKTGMLRKLKAAEIFIQRPCLFIPFR